MKRFFIGLCLMSLVFLPNSMIKIPNVYAASPGEVVINEIAWMGSADSSNDEWIELYNNTSGAIDLSGWSIDDDNGSAIYTIASGTIAAHGYFLIEDTEDSTSVQSDAVLGVSLANTGDSLILKDELGQTIDAVNSTGGAWYAGNSTGSVTMERIDPLMNGDDSANWADNTIGNGATGRSGSTINGTPGTVNSVYSGGSVGMEANFGDLTVNPVEGDTFTIDVNVNNSTDMMSFGFDVLYDPTILQYVSASEGDFLNEGGSTSTSFYSDLEDGIPGKIVTGGSRLTVPPSGVSGSGKLFDVTFQAVTSGTSQISFDTGSFASDTTGDITLTFDTDDIVVDAASIDPALNLTVSEGTNRYELDLVWNAPVSGADSYRVMRRDTSDAFVEIATTTALNYTDSNNLIPNHIYEYQVIAVKGSLEANPANGQGQDTRGIKGDNNRSDRVDGRDLENLAKHYTLGLLDAGFDPLIDTTYDGIIDGSDLIDIGANWATTY